VELFQFFIWLRQKEATVSEQSPLKVLILTNDTGLGHRSTAKAIAAALQAQHGRACKVDIVNPTEHKLASPILRNSSSDYDRLVRDWPDFYRFSYEAVSGPLPSALVESAFTVMLYLAVMDILKTYQPDVIVNTYETYHGPLDAVFALTQQRVPLITAVTDLATLHRSWFNDVVDLCLVPTSIAYDLALEYGLPPEKVKLTGLPVNPAFAETTRSRGDLRAELGWPPDRISVLAVGSTRVRNLPETLHVLNHSGLPLHFAVVCGGDDDLYAHFSHTDWHQPTHVYNFVDNMPLLMHAADCTVGKAGGLFVSEALACGLPILLIDLIQGQETGNAEFVIKGGAGELAANPIQALELLFHWLDKNGQLLVERTRNAQSLGHPRAAYEAADLIWDASQSGTGHRHRSTRNIRKLKEMLDKFNVPWKDVGKAPD
jgi:UDP-N-acetylglucosamine:LPS N-acetylglucosamine transferase